MRMRYSSSVFALAVLLYSVILFEPVFSQTDFYQGKSVTVIVSTAPGDTGDLRVKALLPFLRKDMLGNPTLVVEYMDGGGGRKAANYLFRNARADGLTVGAMGSGVVGLHIMRESSSAMRSSRLCRRS
jgi:tripartite-type tricarboxylate transporter receptor subunit TctC